MPSAPVTWASLLPPLPILDDISNLPTMQLQAYCLAYELPTISISPSDMRANLKRVRQIYQGDTSQLNDTDRRTLFDAWGIEGEWSTAPSDHIAVVLVGYAISLAMRYNASAYCRSPLQITTKPPTVISGGKGSCDIQLELDAATEAGQPLTGTGECDIVVSVISANKSQSLVFGSKYYSVDSSARPIDAGVLQIGGVVSGSGLFAVDSELAPVDG